MRQWILNQRRLNGHVGMGQVHVNIWDPPETGRQTSRTAGKGGANVLGKRSILVDIGSNINLIGLRVAMEFREAARARG